ncbi:MAG TPA: hypothetical protein DC057_05345 [Spirochaetia bacterium]|nr:hypothetical protein [Spirochaetia bacterium]
MSFHKANKSKSTRINQGDIFKNIPFIEKYFENDGKFELGIIDFPHIYILTQDCDLEQNSNERIKNSSGESSKLDKYLISILVAPIYNVQHVFDGNHLEFLGITSERHNSSQREKIKQNQNQRYHYIELSDNLNLSPLVIDFKHYFSITLDTLEEKLENRECQVEAIYRESISQRFAFYLSRIGLPNL